ncbi:hypothetical protein [Pseudogulbenkiania subflava]|uniref:Uncharacterized protein n=1 Tax=Pseudogulbenkiania subflava DSM 22618 TaxID=1123014 RepID=A0A1Y6BC68_9NEIS|nr:hypothetical protein [Pseudogulbenkiania subflava]SME97239.1 hypothetical protein SAMN02745746_00416 [Pseudogulbenkiania subflava DSM 22618]
MICLLQSSTARTPPSVLSNTAGNVRELRNVAERYCLGLGDGLEAETAAPAAR